MPTPAEESVMADFGHNVDTAVFEQILDMDDDDGVDREFSHDIVFGFFEQATTTFEQMDEALEKKDLASLSSLGHFLKGSSATLGFTKVKDECEKIQHYGQMKDDKGTEPMDDEQQCLDLISNSLDILKKDYMIVEKLMRIFYAAIEDD